MALPTTLCDPITPVSGWLELLDNPIVDNYYYGVRFDDLLISNKQPIDTFTLNSLSFKEEIDPQFLTTSIASGTFSCTTPFLEPLSESSLDELYQTFAKKRRFIIEGGFFEKIDGIVQRDSVDVVKFGVFEITETKIDNTTMEIVVKFEHILNEQLEKTFYLGCGGAASMQPGWLYDCIFETEYYTFIYDTLLAPLIDNPILTTDTRALFLQLNNLTGSQWVMNNTGTMEQFVGNFAEPLNYYIQENMIYGKVKQEPNQIQPLSVPLTYSKEEGTQEKSYGLTTRDFQLLTGFLQVSDVGFSGGFTKGTLTKQNLTLPDAFSAYSSFPIGLYGNSGGIFVTIPPSGINQTSVPLEAVHIASGKLEINQQTDKPTNILSVNNPLVSQQPIATQIIERSSVYPQQTFIKKYTWEGRDDPSLRLNQVVHIPINGKWVKALLTKYTRRYNGASRVEWEAVHIEDTDTPVYTVTPKPITMFMQFLGEDKDTRVVFSTFNDGVVNARDYWNVFFNIDIYLSDVLVKRIHTTNRQVIINLGHITTAQSQDARAEVTVCYKTISSDVIDVPLSGGGTVATYIGQAVSGVEQGMNMFSLGV